MSLSTTIIQYQQEHAADTAVPRLIAVFIICFVISYASIILRFVSRRLSRTKLRAADWLILLSALFTTAFLSLNIYLTQIGLGRHAVLIENPKSFVIGYTLLEVLYVIAIFIIKLSTLYLWHHLFPGRGFTITLYIIGAVLVAYSITQIACVVTQCIPLSSLWDPSLKGTCIDLDTVFVICSSFNVATDFCIVVLPTFQLSKLKISARQKLQLVVLFCLGGFVLIISIIRIPQLTEISQTDQSWTLTDSAIWTSLECAIATLSACLPTMRPLFSRIAGHKPNKTRTIVYTEGKSNRPTWAGRSMKSRAPSESMVDTQPFAKDQEASYWSYVPLEEAVRSIKTKKQLLNNADEDCNLQDLEEARY